MDKKNETPDLLANLLASIERIRAEREKGTRRGIEETTGDVYPEARTRSLNQDKDR